MISTLEQSYDFCYGSMILWMFFRYIKRIEKKSSSNWRKRRNSWLNFSDRKKDENSSIIDLKFEPFETNFLLLLGFPLFLSVETVTNNLGTVISRRVMLWFLSCVSVIWTRVTWLWWFVFRLELIFAPSASKTTTFFKSDHKKLFCFFYQGLV